MRLTGLRVMSMLLLAVGACRPGEEPPPSPSVAKSARADERAGSRPSFLLVVVDTLRADAVSAYGSVKGTTPQMDALASEGIRYTRAFAPSPWTLPSHATLFSGVGPEHHGVGSGGRLVLPGNLPLLAERMADAGYETVGVSENPLIAAHFGLTRGFEHFAHVAEDLFAPESGSSFDAFDVVQEVRSWAGQRSPQRPFLLFVNLFDPHDPYELHEKPRFLPEGADLARARYLGHGSTERGISALGMCKALPPPRDLAILRGLYHGEVAAADAKLAAIHETAKAAAGGPLITVVTSDHGEHLGEHGLLGHQFSVRSEVLHVPLIVHGLEKASPASIDVPVALVDLAPSILSWGGVPSPESWTGRTLPQRAGEGRRDRTLLALWSDAPLHSLPGLPYREGWHDRRRGSCGSEHRVFGRMLALTRYPHKLVWYEEYPSELFDLSWDPGERSDVASHQRGLTASLVAELEPFRDALDARIRADTDPGLTAEQREALQALGYVE